MQKVSVEEMVSSWKCWMGTLTWAQHCMETPPQHLSSSGCCETRYVPFGVHMGKGFWPGLGFWSLPLVLSASAQGHFSKLFLVVRIWSRRAGTPVVLRKE